MLFFPSSGAPPFVLNDPPQPVEDHRMIRMLTFSLVAVKRPAALRQHAREVGTPTSFGLTRELWKRRQATQDGYQAYACGAGPPTPGNNLSNRFKISGSSWISAARANSATCCGVRGPMIGAVTAGAASVHAKATLAGVSPNSAHNR
jgi:hypothetical protein